MWGIQTHTLSECPFSFSSFNSLSLSLFLLFFLPLYLSLSLSLLNYVFFLLLSLYFTFFFFLFLFNSFTLLLSLYLLPSLAQSKCALLFLSPLSLFLSHQTGIHRKIPRDCVRWCIEHIKFLWKVKFYSNKKEFNTSLNNLNKQVKDLILSSSKLVSHSEGCGFESHPIQHTRWI